MLWVAFFFPRLSRAALPGLASPEPAGTAGAQALEAAAMWLCQFTPCVSLEPPRSVLAEVEASLRLFGGPRALLRRFRHGLRELGFEVSMAMGRTPRAALWRAAGGGGRIESLPLEAAGLDREALDFLHGIGVRTIGELGKLPRAGLARRVSPRLIEQLDQARGGQAEPRAFFALPEQFAARLELPAQVSEAQAVLFAARRLLVQMEGFLAARHAGIRRFTLALVDREGARKDVRVGLAAPARDAGHLADLLRERLQALTITAPVEVILVEARDLVPLAGGNRSFVADPQSDAESWLRLVERLRARIGERAVQGFAVHAEHRPELAWRLVEPGARAGRMPRLQGLRPLWLLEPPCRIGEGDFVLLAGPERIESGWWDGAEMKRDYFVAQGRDHALVWIYRDARSWFLHGIFA